MKLGIDIDGCLASFTGGYTRLLKQQRDLPITYDVWDWDKKAGYTKEERDNAWHQIHTTDFWFELEPLDGALDALEQLESMSEDNDIYFITHRSGKQAKQQTEDWLFQYGITTPTVLISGLDKSPLISSLELNFYVDDKFDNVHKALMLRLYGFHLYMVDAPYNHGMDMMGIERVKSVKEALDRYGK